MGPARGIRGSGCLVSGVTTDPEPTDPRGEGGPLIALYRAGLKANITVAVTARFMVNLRRYRPTCDLFMAVSESGACRALRGLFSRSSLLGHTFVKAQNYFSNNPLAFS